MSEILVVFYKKYVANQVTAQLFSWY